MKRPDLRPMHTVIKLKGTPATRFHEPDGVIRIAADERARPSKPAAPAQQQAPQRPANVAGPTTLTTASSREVLPPSEPWRAAREGADDYLSIPSLQSGKRVYRRRAGGVA